MAEEEAERPEAEPERGNEESWYFDLPSGAWERQEQKNRDLRKAILSNMEDSKKDAFAPAQKKGGLFGGRSKEKDFQISDRDARKAALEAESRDSELQAGSAWTTPSEVSLARQPLEPADDWSTESFEMGSAETEAPPPLRRRFTAVPEAELEPEVAAPETKTEESSYIRGEDAPKSRWDEVFSAPAAEGNLIDGLRGWAKSADEAESERSSSRRRFFGAPAEENAVERPHQPPAGEREPRPLPLIRRTPSAPPPSEDGPDIDAPTSRWDDVMSAPAGDFGLLEVMKQWTAKADEEAPKRRRMFEPVEDDDEDEPSASRWDEPVPPTSQGKDDVPASSLRPGPMERLAALNLGGATDESDDEQDDIFGLNLHLKSPVTHTPIHETEKKKGGGLGRLFGKKKKPQEPQALPPTALDGAWLPDDEAEFTQPIVAAPREAKWDEDATEWDLETTRLAAANAGRTMAAPDEVDWEATGTTDPAVHLDQTEEATPRWSWLKADSVADIADPENAQILPTAAQPLDDGWGAWELPSTIEEVSASAKPDETPIVGSATVYDMEEDTGTSEPKPHPEPEQLERVEALAEAPSFNAYAAPAADDGNADEADWQPVLSAAADVPLTDWAMEDTRDRWEPELISQPAPMFEPASAATRQPLFEVTGEEHPAESAVAPDAFATHTATVPDRTDQVESPPDAANAVESVAPFSPEGVPDQGSVARIPEVDEERSGVAAFKTRGTVAEDDDLWASVAAFDIEELTVTPVVAASSTSYVDDDPWADFLSLPSTEPSATDSVHQAPPIPSGASAGSWDEAFNVLAQGEPEPDPFEEVVPPYDDVDDPWAALAPAAVIVAEAPELSPKVRENGTRFDLLYDEAGLDGDPEPEPVFIAPESYVETVANTHTPEYTRPPVAENAYWIDDGEPDEDDVVLRAFEAHAATPQQERYAAHHAPAPPVAQPEEHVFEELLGEEGDEMVEEVSAASADFRSFGRQQGWAPQRSAVELSAPALSPRAAPRPWETPFDAPPSAPRFDHPEEFAAPDRDKADSGSKTRTLIRELVETGLLALLVFLSVRASFQNFKVDGLSMFPTLEDGQFLIVNKLVYAEVDVEKLSTFVPFVDPGDTPQRYVFHGPERGDIVVLKDPRVPAQDLIKRVVGLPGETIEIKDGRVYINDFRLEEPYIKSEWHDNKGKVLIPAGEYFVMGDNRDNSKDSRSSQVGFVPKDLIIGKATLSYWPKNKFGLAPNEPGSSDKPTLSSVRITEVIRAQDQSDAAASPAAVAAAP